MTDKDTLEALKRLEREIYNLEIETRCHPAHLGFIRGAYSELSEAIIGEEHHWAR